MCERKQSRIKDFGKRALLVTGKNSAKASGAFSDVVEVLESMALIMRFMTEWQTILLLKMSRGRGSGKKI